MAHIPTVDIRQLGDISFDRQLELARQPNRDYDVDRWLFVPNTYTEYRYILGTRGKKPLICVGINLLREGLDLPEVSMVAILDADKEGFLRSETSLIQTIGRAARNAEGLVVLYADTVTPSMRAAIT